MNKKEYVLEILNEDGYIDYTHLKNIREVQDYIKDMLDSNIIDSANKVNIVYTDKPLYYI